MEPPSYEEASRHPPARSTGALNVPPPPAYDASLTSPPTPPPSYGEAVVVQPDPFPVLTSLSLPPVVTSPHHDTGVTVHPLTQIQVTSPVSSRHTQPAVVVTQPRPVPISVTYLRDLPGLVHCPQCHHVVTTKVTFVPGKAAWCMCVLISVMGLVCGCCLIPLMAHSLQDAHHSCPRCGNTIHVYAR